jgi:hypothetical protein
VKASTHTPKPPTKAMLLIHLQLMQTKLTSWEYTDDRHLLEALGFHSEAALAPAGFEARCDVTTVKFASPEVAP